MQTEFSTSALAVFNIYPYSDLEMSLIPSLPFSKCSLYLKKSVD